MVADAEASKEADQKRRELIDMKNDADNSIYNVEAQLREHGDKIPQNVKDQINGDVSSLNEAITTEDPEKIKEALERLKNSWMEIGKSIYSQQSSDSDDQAAKESQEFDLTFRQRACSLPRDMHVDVVLLDRKREIPISGIWAQRRQNSCYAYADLSRPAATKHAERVQDSSLQGKIKVFEK